MTDIKKIPLIIQMNRAKNKFKLSKILKYLSILAISITIAALLFIVLFISVNGIQNVSWHFIFGENTHRIPTIKQPIINTLTIIGCSLLLSVPIGVLCAIYLSEYAKRGSKIVKVIILAAETLAGIPSIVYAIFGMVFFVHFLGWGYSLKAGICTITLMILPLIIRSSEEALKSVPDTYREGSYAIGAGKVRTVFRIVLPSSINGILAGIILSIGRIVGESAAFIYTAGTTRLTLNQGLNGQGATLAVAMYMFYAGYQNKEAYATGFVLLVIVLTLNVISTFIGKRIKGAQNEN